jgi:hypothetical protein
MLMCGKVVRKFLFAYELKKQEALEVMYRKKQEFLEVIYRKASSNLNC